MRLRKKKTEETPLVLDMRSLESENHIGTNPATDKLEQSDERTISKKAEAKKPSDKKAEAMDEQTLERADADKDGQASTDNSSVEVQKGEAGLSRLALVQLKKFARFVFLDGLGGMTLGLFATLIVGTIIAQIGKYVGDNFVGNVLTQIGSVAKLAMGAGIGVGVACKFKKPPLVVVSAAVAGLIGAHADGILGIVRGGGTLSIASAGEPVGAFVAAIAAVGFGDLVAGKTKIDIILTPLVAIISGAIFGLLAGPPVSTAMEAIGTAISWAMDQNKIVMGIIIAVLMGMALTLPISSAALGVGLKLSGLAAGAAAVGCCCQMVGFAVASFRENKWGGLAAQGIGTSMLQMPNIIKKPLIWLPPIIASAILGPISAAVFGMTNNAIGSGMGTAGLVGPLMAFEDMTAGGLAAWQAILQISLMHFLLPAAICLGISELMRKLGWIKKDEMKLTIN